MAIDTSGRWWHGENASDLAEYLQLAKPGGYRVDRVLAVVCGECAGTTFKLRADQDEGGVERTCAGCAKPVLMLDTGDHWDDMDPTTIECPCGSDLFEVSVGFSLRADDEIRWVSVGQRCAKDGVLGDCADWKIDYGPTQDLLASV
jgi:hypothetical protein